MIEELRRVLEVDEGCIYGVYLDHLGKPTVGIGHLVTEQDEEFGWPPGAPVSEERVAELFERDVIRCLNDCRWINPNFDQLPIPAQVTMASLAFQLGGKGYSSFKKHHAAIEAGDWMEAAAQLRDSKLYRQTPQRAERHAKRLESLVG